MGREEAVAPSRDRRRAVRVEDSGDGGGRREREQSDDACVRMRREERAV